jgi:hypothetical protein
VRNEAFITSLSVRFCAHNLGPFVVGDRSPAWDRDVYDRGIHIVDFKSDT